MTANEPVTEASYAKSRDEAIRARASVPDRRHPAEVTADRLLEHVERWHDKFEPAERDDLSRVRFVLQQIADGER